MDHNSQLSGIKKHEMLCSRLGNQVTQHIVHLVAIASHDIFIPGLT